MTYTITFTNEELDNISNILNIVDPSAQNMINTLLERNRTTDFGGYKITTMNHNSYEFEICEDLSRYLLTGPVMDLIHMYPMIKRIFTRFGSGCAEFVKEPIIIDYDDDGNVISSKNINEFIEGLKNEMDTIASKEYKGDNSTSDIEDSVESYPATSIDNKPKREFAIFNV